MAKRAGVESQYCVVPRKSIKLLGESVGIGYLSSEVASTLAEDASYRIRQSVQVLVNDRFLPYSLYHSVGNLSVTCGMYCTIIR